MDNEDQGLDIEALVSKAVEKASATRAVAAAADAVAEKAPEIVSQATAQANATTKAVISEVARALKSDMDAKLEETQKEFRALRGTFSLVPGKTEERPHAQEPGILGARIVRAWLAGGEHMDNVPRVLADLYKDRAASDYVARTLETSVPSKGGQLIVPGFAANEFIDRLFQEAVVYPMCKQIPMPSGSLSIPGFASGPNMGWVGETTKNRASSASFRGITMSSKKAFVLVPISNDLLEEASLDADRIVADDIVRVLAELVDNQLINGTRTEHTPGGLYTNQDITKTSHGAAADADLPAEILARVQTRKVNANPMNSCWVMNPTVRMLFYNLKTTTGAYHFRDEMNRGTLMGFPIKVTTHIANSVASNNPTELYFGNFSELLVGVNRDLRFERSREAAYYDEDGNVAAAFARDLTLLMGTFKMDSAVRRPEAFDITTNVYTS